MSTKHTMATSLIFDILIDFRRVWTNPPILVLSLYSERMRCNLTGLRIVSIVNKGQKLADTAFRFFSDSETSITVSKSFSGDSIDFLKGSAIDENDTNSFG